MSKLLRPDTKDLGEFQVARVLPNAEKTMVGPFVFFDHMGPAKFEPGNGVNVRPHPHIGLATVTYLFDGSILHRDSLGSVQEIFPGDVNWMTAGKGIVHSERETLEVRATPHSLHGIQCWLALPEQLTEIEPSFVHVKKCNLPHILCEGVMMRLIAGDAFGRSSPIKVFSPMFYLDVVAQAGSTVGRPNPSQEAALYIESGKLSLAGQSYRGGDFVLLDESDTDIVVVDNARFLLLGGERFDKVPHLHWNFVAYSREKIAEARQQWQDNRFPPIPGDEEEYIPLPPAPKA